MNKYTYSLTLAATNEKEADEKMRALTTLASRLTAKEVGALANIVANDPIKTALAKKYLGL